MSVDAAPHRKPAVKELTGELLASRYRIEEKLGEGAMGAVYRARHVKVGRSFAVKVLHPHLLEDAKTALRFEREAELAGRLRHLNVIGVIDVGETPEGLRYMVMDYAQGGDLADLLSEAPMPPARIISLVRQMLEGLHHAHEAGLIHRDFKPENVLVERDDSGREIPRIVDFGISILREGGGDADGTGRLTTNGLVLGTPHYMAPEQAVADPIDHRIDLFAMGIVIYEMLCGQLPFDGSGAEVARANLLLDPPPISKRVPHLEVDPLLEAFARRLMEKSRDQRPATARAARELLDLIERDRAAAATALGVSVAAGTRDPQLTEPLPPLPPLPPRPQPSHPTAPAMPATATGGVPQQLLGPGASAPAGAAAAAVALDMPPYPGPRVAAVPATTTMTDPLPWNGRPRPPRRWLIGGAAGLAAAGAIAAVALAAGGGGSGAKPQPEPAKIAMTATTAPAPAPAPAPTPVPVPPSQPEAAGSAAAPAIADSVPTRPDPETPAGKPGPGASKRQPRPAIKTGTKPEATKPEATKPEATKPEPTRTAAITPDKAGAGKPPTESAPLPPEDPNDRLLAEYQQVHSELRALEKALDTAAVQDLWLLYRRVSYNAAISDEGKRRLLNANLATIRSDIAKRKKR